MHDCPLILTGLVDGGGGSPAPAGRLLGAGAAGAAGGGRWAAGRRRVGRLAVLSGRLAPRGPRLAGPLPRLAHRAGGGGGPLHAPLPRLAPRRQAGAGHALGRVGRLVVDVRLWRARAQVVGRAGLDQLQCGSEGCRSSSLHSGPPYPFSPCATTCTHVQLSPPPHTHTKSSHPDARRLLTLFQHLQDLHVGGGVGRP